MVPYPCLRFHGSFVYFATVIDVFTREILGFTVRTRHNAELVMTAISYALLSGRRLEIIHSTLNMPPSSFREKFVLG